MSGRVLEFDGFAQWADPYRTSKIRCYRTGPRAWVVEAHTRDWASRRFKTRREAAGFLNTAIRHACVLGQVHVETVIPAMASALKERG